MPVLLKRPATPVGAAAPAPTGAPTSAGIAAPALAPGTDIGSFTVGSVLGAGGFGVVYRAHQKRPSRDVALKLIRPGTASQVHDPGHAGATARRAERALIQRHLPAP